jgi:hypothetical protein
MNTRYVVYFDFNYKERILRHELRKSEYFISANVLM